jgi:hypothetical protein
MLSIFCPEMNEHKKTETAKPLERIAQGFLALEIAGKRRFQVMVIRPTLGR